MPIKGFKHVINKTPENIFNNSINVSKKKTWKNKQMNKQMNKKECFFCFYFLFLFTHFRIPGDGTIWWDNMMTSIDPFNLLGGWVTPMVEQIHPFICSLSCNFFYCLVSLCPFCSSCLLMVVIMQGPSTFFFATFLSFLWIKFRLRRILRQLPGGIGDVWGSCLVLVFLLLLDDFQVDIFPRKSCILPHSLLQCIVRVDVMVLRRSCCSFYSSFLICLPFTCTRYYSLFHILYVLEIEDLIKHEWAQLALSCT